MSRRPVRVQKDIQDGLVQLLVGALVPEERHTSFGVITTAPGGWVGLRLLKPVTIIDATGITGPTLWITESDIRERVLDSIHLTGWPDEHIRLEYRSSLISADIVLTDKAKQPIALVDVKHDLGVLTEAIERVRQCARLLNARFGIVTDGNRFLLTRSGTELIEETRSFPSLGGLAQYGLDRSTNVVSDKESPRTTILKPTNVVELHEQLIEFADGKLVLDYTLPFGDRDATAAAQVRSFLPEITRPFKYLDSTSAVLLLAATNTSIKRCVSLLPAGVGFSLQHSGLRDFIVGRLPLAGVVDVAAGVLPSATKIACTLVALGDFPITSEQRVFVMELPGRGEIVQIQTQSWFRDLKNGLQGRDTNLGFWIPAIAKLPWSASVLYTRMGDAYRTAATQNLKRLGDSVLLGEVCDVFLGFQHSRQESKGNTAIPIIRGRDLSAHPLTKEGLGRFVNDRSIPEKSRVVTGDILIQRIGHNPKCDVVGPELEGAVASDTVLVIRPREQRVDSSLVCQFLRSTIGQQLLQLGTKGDYAPTLSAAYLKTVPLPLLSQTLIRELNELQEIEQSLKLRAERMESLRLNLFSAESLEEFRRQMVEIRRAAAVVTTSLDRAEERNYQIRNLYPFPLAFAYRNLTSYTVVHELYAEQLNFVENILAFLGSISSTLMDSAVRESTGVRLDSWRGGMSLGKWREVCIGSAKAFQKYETSMLPKQLASLWIGKKQPPFAKRMEELIVARNDYHHNRGPKGEAETRRASDRVSELLKWSMEDLAFLIECPMRLVKDINAIRGNRRVRIQTLKYVGDHPGLMQEEMDYKEALTKNDLYLALREDDWLPLYPLITARDCPRCRYRETYYIDRWDGVGKDAVLKSFERGHIEYDADIGAGLKAHCTGQQ